MNTTSVQNHIDLFFIGTAGISALTIFFLLLSWGLGGSEFFHRALLGDTLLPALAALFVSGVVMILRRSRKARQAASELRTAEA